MKEFDPLKYTSDPFCYPQYDPKRDLEEGERPFVQRLKEYIDFIIDTDGIDETSSTCIY
jgi:hypothetical protein